MYFINRSLFSAEIKTAPYVQIDDAESTRIVMNALKNDEYLLIFEEYLSYLQMDKNIAGEDYYKDVLHLLLKIKNKADKDNNYGRNKHICQYVMQFGDQPLKISSYPTAGIPVFKKTRFIGQENVLLLKLTVERHWLFWSEIEAYDMPFKEKRSNILWRGTMTGYKYCRYNLVNKYFKNGRDAGKYKIIKWIQKLSDHFSPTYPNGNLIDIAFHDKGQNYNEWKDNGKITDHLIRDRMEKRDMLRSKYLVSVPGNDIATNLNWVLFSNSVPFLMQDDCNDKKEKESWTMHGLLQPYIHYIPFKLSDDSLMKAYEFCESNLENCSRIAQNGKQWMMQFMDPEREDKIQMKMLKLYCQNILIE